MNSEMTYLVTLGLNKEKGDNTRYDKRSNIPEVAPPALIVYSRSLFDCCLKYLPCAASNSQAKRSSLIGWFLLGQLMPHRTGIP